MAWHASGEDRVRSYRIYKDLEAERDALQRELIDARRELVRRDGLIRAMAQELTAMAERLDIPAPMIPKETTISGGMVLPAPQLPQDGLLPQDKGLPQPDVKTLQKPSTGSGIRPAVPHPSTIVGRYSQSGQK